MSGLPSVERASSAAPESIQLSALNHHLYCARRAYLIHAERIFVDNEHTTLGNLVHAAVDTPGYEHREGWELLRALPLYSDILGLTGKADLVEILRAPLEPKNEDCKYQVRKSYMIVEVRPVEYKKGPARRWSNDHVQLCAQALCLEEMLDLRIASGLIYHAASAKRDEVIFDDSLRTLTRSTLDSLRFTLARPMAPVAVFGPRCEGCSLRGVCLPEAMAETSHKVSLFEPRAYS